MESDSVGPAGRRRSLQVRMLGHLTISPGRRRASIAGIPQGARALRLSGPRAARGAAEPALRIAVGHSQRPARRAPLVPQQDQEHPRRAWPPAQVDTQDDTIRLDLADCFVDAIEIARATAGGHRDARPGAAASAGRAVRRRLSRGPGNRPQPALRRLADRSAAPFRGCHAALLEHLVESVPMTRRSDTSSGGSGLRRSIGASTSSC